MARKKKDEPQVDTFIYVDAYHSNPAKDFRTKWVRKRLDEIQGFAQAYKNFNIFQTVQLYQNPVRPENGDELTYAPLFFDIDSSRALATEIKEGKKVKAPGLIELGVVGTFDLEKHLPKDLISHVGNYELGIDLPDDISEKINALVAENEELSQLVWLKNIELSRKDATKILHYFISKFGMSEDEIRVYFSGSKGFHILINPVTLGIQPEKNLHRIFKFIATHLEAQLGLQSLDTATIYGTRRMLRLANSMHHKSGLFKIEITHEELKGNLWNLIRPGGLAATYRDELYPPGTSYTVNDQAYAWYVAKADAYKETEKLRVNRVTLKDTVLSQMEDLPVCMQFVLERGILKTGDRNKATMVLASYYKDTGVPMDETVAILCEWVKKIPPSFTSSSPSEVQASTVGCVKTVYMDDKYHFGCAYIRSLHGERQGKSYEAVPCAGRACPAHEDYAIDQEPAQLMHLAQTAKAELTGTKVAFNALVSGKMDTPYIVPKSVRYICHHQAYCEKDCIMHDYSGLYEREFHENERFLIEVAGQNDNNTKGILFYHSGASCKKVKSEVLQHENITELLVVPMADRVKSIKNSDGTSKEVDQNGNEYVARKIYAVGEPNAIPKSNEHYEVEGYVYSHPKNAMATILSQKHQPLEDSIAKFTLTDDIRENFKVFQVQPGETIDDRVDLLVSDLVEHVTRVYDRFEPHLATLLTYHSCLHYYFQGRLEKRGWMETILVGDSGQAKSLLVESLMEYAGLGNTASGEMSSRTGLVYRLEQLGERWFITWGKYPLSDRKLLAIDEFSALNKEEFGMITEARTSGVLSVDRTVNTETNARVRLLLLTNPVHGTLSSFAHGVESLRKLFHSPADIRRLDLAVFLQTGDVSRKVLNSEIPENVVATEGLLRSEVFRDSILWAWSRTADDIEITKPAMKRILKKAEELSDVYGYAQDIPLLEPADLRKKLARMAIALASLLHSTDEAHEKVIVLPEHVDYIELFLNVVYKNKNARLDVYSMKSKEETELTDEEAEKITEALEQMDFSANVSLSAEILELFRKNDVLKPSEVVDMLGFERAEVNARLAILTKYSMIKRTREGLRKLPKFIEYLNTGMD